MKLDNSIWLFGYLVSRITSEKGTIGIVNYGKPITDEEVAKHYGTSVRTIKRWRGKLTHLSYIAAKRTHSGTIYYVNKSKKFIWKGDTSVQKGDTDVPNNILSKKLISSNNILYKEIIEDLNVVLRSKYRYTTPDTRKLIAARWKEGFRLEDFKIVHRKMYDEWNNNEDMCKYLRPETLYSKKFEGYLNRPTKPKVSRQEELRKKFKLKEK